jgi:hypothetical protein
VDRSFVAENRSQLRVSEDFGDLDGFALELHFVANEAHSVAVVDVPVDVDSGERLDRLSIQLPPAVDGDAARALVDIGSEDDVLLGADG